MNKDTGAEHDCKLAFDKACPKCIARINRLAGKTTKPKTDSEIRNAWSTDAGKVPRVIKTVADIPANYSLVQDSQDVASCLEYIGKVEELGDTGCLFVEYTDADIGSVYQCSGYVPLLSARVYRLQ